MDRALSDAIRWHLEAFLRSKEDPGSIRAQVSVRPEDEDQAPSPYSYERGADLVYKHLALETVFRYVLWDLQWFASQNVRAFLALHAGAVTTREGAILLPASRDTGKSTLVASLLQRGFRYLSDEIGPIDPVTGRAYPFPKHLHLDQNALNSFPGLEERLADRNGHSRGRLDRTVRPQDLDAEIGEPSPVRAVVFMTSERDGSPRLTPMTKAEAIERMAENCFNLHRYAERGVILFSRIAASAPAFTLEGGSAQERAEVLAERFEQT